MSTPATRTAQSGGDFMVATGHPIAAAAARIILQAGGSAIDAAIAADAVMGVVEPMATSIGGDLQAMIVEPGHPPCTYNGTGRAPAALTPEMVERLPGRRIPERHPLSVTVPGAVRGWQDLHRRYGRLEWKQLFDVAIRAASEGFPVAQVAAKEWQWFDPVLHVDPACANLYRAGNPPKAGEIFRNPALAATLRGIASEGDGYFYDGALAISAAQSCQALGGILSAADFAAHTGMFCNPLQGKFRDLTVLECPPNSHGCAVLDALAEVDTLDLDPEDPNTLVSLVIATGRAMAKAKETVADPAGNTVCTAIVDGNGLAVTLMSSIFKRFGSGIAVAAGGFVLQNRGFGFSSPGHINGPAGGKRPYHTVIPAACLKGGQFHAVFGVVGGLMQPQGHIQLMVRLAAWNQSADPAIRAPRWRLEAGNQLAIEPGIAERLVAALREHGFAKPPPSAGELAGRSDFGGAQLIMRNPDGILVGASDPRKDGMVCSSQRGG